MCKSSSNKPIVKYVIIFIYFFLHVLFFFPPRVDISDIQSNSVINIDRVCNMLLSLLHQL
jgi:hypothetical protein